MLQYRDLSSAKTGNFFKPFCPRLLLRELESYISSRTDPHQPQERGIKLRHYQIEKRALDENESQHNGPHRDLKPVKAETVPIFKNIKEAFAAWNHTDGRKH